MAGYPEPRPYISVVVGARNDDHGGNMLGRMQAFVNAWIVQAKRYSLPSELVIVEWNAPGNRAKLIDSLDWPSDPQPCSVRFVEVPPEIHRRFDNPDSIPLHQMIAKNVGIRRARGEFIIATNLDVIFSAELMQLFAERRLESGKMYRMDRHDVASAIPTPATVDELLTYCHNNTLRVFVSEGKFEFGPDGFWALEKEDIVAHDAGIRFGPGWHAFQEYQGDVFRWLGNNSELVVERPSGGEPRLLMDVQLGPSAGGKPVTLELLDAAGSLLASARVEGRSRLRLHFPDLVTSARLRLRVRGMDLPLERDPRILNLRVFAIWWDGWTWTREPYQSYAAFRKVDSGIRVRSIEPGRIQLVVHPGEQASLTRLGLNLMNATGDVISQMTADQNQTGPGGEYLLTLDLGFKFAEPGNSSGESSNQAWALEVVSTMPGIDWSSTFYSVSPFAAEMRKPVYLHTNASGDFTLLSREDWFALRGYAEFPIWPLHIDALFCYAAHHAGIQEVLLGHPMRIFHVQHQSGAGWSPRGEAELNSRIESRNVNVIRFHDAAKWIERMRRYNSPVIFTTGKWGLADEEFKETLI